MCMVPIFTSGALVFMAAAQGTPIDPLALVLRDTCIPETHRTRTIGETILDRLQPPGHCTDSRMKHNSNPSVKEAYLLLLELHSALRAGFRFGA